MASEGGKRTEVDDPAKTTGEEEVGTEEDDLAKTTDEKEAQTEEDDLAKTTGEEEGQTEEAQTEEANLAKTTGEEEARAEKDEAKEEASEGNGSPREDSITNIPGSNQTVNRGSTSIPPIGSPPVNIPGSDQTVNRGSASIPPIGSPPVVASVHNNSNQSFGTQQQQQLSPRMLTTGPRSQAAHNSAAASFVANNAPRRPNQITRPFFPEPAFVAPMRPMVYNQPQDQMVPNILRGQAPMRPMVFNQPQEQIVPNVFRGQAPMMYNQAQDQVVPNVFPGQAPVRPMVYNNQQQPDQEMQQLQAQMQQPAESQGSNSGPPSGQSQD